MALVLHWMRPEAPYMPVATAGLLRTIRRRDPGVRACWRDDGGPSGTSLVLVSDLDADGIAEAVLGAPWPDLDRVPWPHGRPKQGLRPTLAEVEDPAAALRSMTDALRTHARSRGDDPDDVVEIDLLRAIVTDGALDDAGLPMRSRLLRGVKADLSGVTKPPRATAEALAAELRDGPRFRSGASGLGLGLVPEVQTFGGTTGPEPSSVGAYSVLLHRLLWHGVLALPPVPVARGRTRTAGGPLSTRPDVLSWPVWSTPCDLPMLRAVFGLAEVHAEVPDVAALAARGLSAVYRADAVPLSSMVAVYRWGRRIA